MGCGYKADPKWVENTNIDNNITKNIK